MFAPTMHGDEITRFGVDPLSRDREAFEAVVRGGAPEAQGMPRYAEFDEEKLEDVRHFIRARASLLRGDGKVKDAAKGSAGGW